MRDVTNEQQMAVYLPVYPAMGSNQQLNCSELAKVRNQERKFPEVLMNRVYDDYVNDVTH